ncbi:sensor histidine kinase [Lunatibacter salilacus]|uniref:sensor histidine kinase n=1 Tax=Lunatibacter salilacus TaxID=2483804 RepID=UPI00131C6EED|nr:HAMP domain-containing sensor histidine kinase [Lunatibacter salilacus]
MKYRQWVSRKWKAIFFWEKSPVMEKQIFNATIVIIGLYVFVMSILTVSTGQYVLASIFLSCIPFLIYLYYLLRYKNKFITPFILFGLVAYPVLSANFYLNDGIHGSSAYVFILMNLVMASIVPVRWIFGLTLVNVVYFLGLYYLGIYHPEIIPTSYTNETSRFFDHSVTYLGSVLGMTFILMTVRIFYQTQKSKTEINKNELMMVNRDLTKTNFQKDKIIAILTHDLKNPLQSIVQTLELINETDELTQEELAFIHSELLKNTQRTYAMMENILEWSSFELKNQNSRIKDVDLKSLFGDTLEIMKTIANQKGVNLHINYLSNPALTLESDRLLLILRNLIQNAIKFTQVGGEIKLEIGQDENETLISVEDNGIGMSEKQLKDIFQLEIKPTYGTALEKGTGMGLHLCYQNAIKIGAELTVQSTLGMGSSFMLRIPNVVEEPGKIIKPSTPSSF